MMQYHLNDLEVFSTHDDSQIAIHHPGLTSFIPDNPNNPFTDLSISLNIGFETSEETTLSDFCHIILIYYRDYSCSDHTCQLSHF